MSVYIIAEIGQAHDGSLGILHSYIDALSTTGVNAVKFQTHIAEAESSEYEKFRVNFSYVDKTRFDYWRRMEFSLEQWVEIKNHCDQVGLDFISSPFSNKAVDILEYAGVKAYKIGSGEVNNYLLLEKVSKTGKPIIISSGLSSLREVSDAVEFVKAINDNISILQCTTSYPVQPKDIGLNVIKEMKDKFEFPIGLSDHSGEIFPSIAAVSLGAEMLEVHAVFSKNMFGPDSSSSLEISQIKELVRGVRYIEVSLSNILDKNNTNANTNAKNMFGKSLSVNKSMKKGASITFDDLDAKKPAGRGIPASEFKSVLGKTLLTNLDRYQFLNTRDIE